MRVCVCACVAACVRACVRACVHAWQRRRSVHQRDSKRRVNVRMRVCAVHLDLQDSASIAKCLTEFTPDVLINLAALSSPAACEKSKAEAEALNAPLGLLDALAQRNADALFIQVAPWLQDVRARACAGAVPRRSGAPPALEPAAATPEVLVPVGGAMHGGMTEEDE